MVLLVTAVFASCNEENGGSKLPDNGTGSGPAIEDQDPNGGGGVSEYVPVSSPLDDAVVKSAEIKKISADVKTSFFVMDENYFFYVDYADEHLYRIGRDGSGKIQLTDKLVSTVELKDGKIEYAINMESGLKSNCFTIDKDGKNEVDNQKLVLDNLGVKSIVGKDNKVYMNLGINEGKEDSGIYVMDSAVANPDDANAYASAKLVVPGFIDSFTLVDDYIIIAVARGDGQAIYRCKLDGSDVVKLFDAQAHNLNVFENEVYFINKSESNLIYVMTNDAITSA